MKFIDIHRRMVDVDTTHLLSIYNGAIRELCRMTRYEIPQALPGLIGMTRAWRQG